ncbi:7148_t:CDS:2, partial [Dentiscutata heterogama]
MNELKKLPANLNNAKLSIYNSKNTEKMKVVNEIRMKYQKLAKLDKARADKLDFKSYNNDDDNKTWYLCNNEIFKGWLGSNDCEKVKLNIIEKLNKDKELLVNKTNEKIEKSNKAEE